MSKDCDWQRWEKEEGNRPKSSNVRLKVKPVEHTLVHYGEMGPVRLLRLRLRLRLIYLGRIAEKVKYINYQGCAPARREGSRTENWKIYEEQTKTERD